MARPSILEAVERKRQAEAPPPSAPPAPRRQKARPEPAQGREAAPPGGSGSAETSVVSREGKINVSAYFPPEVKASLRLVQAKRGGKVQDLLAEALNLLFAKYNVPESAPMNTKAS